MGDSLITKLNPSFYSFIVSPMKAYESQSDIWNLLIFDENDDVSAEVGVVSMDMVDTSYKWLNHSIPHVHSYGGHNYFLTIFCYVSKEVILYILSCRTTQIIIHAHTKYYRIWIKLSKQIDDIKSMHYTIWQLVPVDIVAISVIWPEIFLSFMGHNSKYNWQL